MSFFLNAFEFPVALRIFDSFLCEGDKVLYRAALALFKYACKGKLLKIKGEMNTLEYEEAFENCPKGD